MRRATMLSTVLLSLACVPGNAEAPTLLRVSVGLGQEARRMIAFGGRFLLGWEGSRWRMGLQAMGGQESGRSVEPVESRTDLVAQLGWEVFPRGSTSLTLLGGAGLNWATSRGALLGEESYGARTEKIYERDKYFGPSGFLGVDLGLSENREFGVSILSGMLMTGNERIPIAMLQFNAGSW